MQKFKEWLEKPIGQRLIELETSKLNTMVATLFGYDAIVLGAENFLPCLCNCQIKRHTLVNPDCAISPGISSRYDKLALSHEVLDLAYLPHCLEFAQNPHEVLREVYRSLRPDGHIIISMFNPWSPWGIYRPFWKANFISLVKLRDWLALLGFDIMRVNRFAFMLPISKKEYPEKLSWFERVGQKFELPLAGVYVVQASKRIIPLTPITPKWQTKPEPAIVVNDGTEPTT